MVMLMVDGSLSTGSDNPYRGTQMPSGDRPPWYFDIRKLKVDLFKVVRECAPRRNRIGD